MSNYIIIGIFLILLYGLSIASLLTPKKTYSENENRILADLPKFTFDTLFEGTFTKKYETFITDQFVMRNQWIGLKTKTELFLQKNDINGVYFGSDGYLIPMIITANVDHEQVDKNILYVKDFVEKYSELLGKEHVFTMVAPTAFEILKDKLPSFAIGYNQDNLLDDLSGHMKDNFIDIRQELKSHSSEYIFYKTDHHWTSLGAYYAYEAWAKQSGLEPLSKENFTIEKVSNSFYGTNSSKVNVKVDPDEMYIFESGNKFAVEYNMNGIIKKSLYEMEQLGTKDKYTVYLNGNNAFVEINSEHKNGKKLLIIKDSYAHCFVPFAANHYETTYMIDFRYFNLPISAVIEEYGITDVLVLYNANTFVEDKNIYNLGR